VLHILQGIQLEKNLKSISGKNQGSM